jgi:cell division protein FtsW (lipid II flippase)
VKSSAFFLAALSLTLLYAAFQKAGTNPTDWNACVLAIGLTVGVYGIVSGRKYLGGFDRITGICIGLFLGLVMFQLVPLPTRIVQILSPARVELQAAVSRLAPDHSHFTTLSATPSDTAQYLLTLAAYALVIVFVSYLRRAWSESSWILVWPLVVVGGLEAALGCFQVSLGGAAEGARGTYMNRDHYAALLEIALPFALLYSVAMLKNERNPQGSTIGSVMKACVGIAVFVLLLSGILLSLSRGAFMASLIAILFCVCGMFFLRTTHNRAMQSRRRWLPWVNICVVCLGILAAFLFLPNGLLIDRFADLPRTEGVSSNTRVQIWTDAVHLMGNYPLFGCGAGSFGSCFLRYKTVAPMVTIDYAHNDYIQVLCEFGMIGFAVGSVLIMRLVTLTIRQARRANSISERYLAIGCLGSIVAILLHSLVDFNMYVPANGLAFAWVLGMSTGSSSHSKKRHSIPESEQAQSWREMVTQNV